MSRLLSFITIVFCLPVFASAATLQAKVVEVESGNTLIVSNINRPLRIRLKALAPPEAGQPFNDTAREHLRLLVLGKAVAVEYTHLIGGYLEAKVFLNGVDVASQMLRDGVAWYDRSSDYQLAGRDRDLYLLCEQAARSEKRGLWQDPAPVAPWEFRRLEQAKLERNTRQSTVHPGRPARTSGQGFSSVDLLGSFSGSGSGLSAPTPRLVSENGSPDRWTTFESATEHFSVLIPSNGIADSYAGPDASGRPISANIVAGGSYQAFYALLRTKSTNQSPSDAAATDTAIHQLIGGMNEGAKRSGATNLISVKPVRQLKIGDYFGKQYMLAAEEFSGAARILTKQTGDQRVLFVLFVLTRRGSESFADRFLNSFKITEP